MSQIIVAPGMHRAAVEAVKRNEVLRTERHFTVYAVADADLGHYACLVFEPSHDLPTSYRPDFLLFPVQAIPGRSAYLIPRSVALNPELATLLR